MIDPRRAAVVAEAVTWLRTPYLHMGRVKGAGCDCLTMLAEVYEACGIIPRVELDYYPPDWNLHRDAERYLEGVMARAQEYEATCFGVLNAALPAKPTPDVGDVAIWKFGRCFAHGAIVMDWPNIIHSWVGVGVVYGNAVTQPGLAKREVRFFDPFGHPT